MIWPVFVTLFVTAIAAAYVSIVRREAELFFGGLSALCWLGVALSASTIQIAVGEELVETGEPGVTAIGIFGLISTIVWIILVASDRVPTDAADFDADNHTHEHNQ